MTFQSAAKVLLGAMLSASAAANPRPASPPPPMSRPAAWQPYDILVHLTNLPRTYTCDELWFKFREVLISLGAGRVGEVLPSNCTTHSPDVHVTFFLPRLLHRDAAGDNAIRAETGTVALAPGHPSHLLPSDCYLVREISESLLTDMPVKVMRAKFECGSTGAPASSPAASNGAHENYALQVQALLPQWPQRTSTPATVQDD